MSPSTGGKLRAISGSVHEYQDIERIAVIAERGRHEAEIIRESHPLGEHRSPRFYRGFDLKSDCDGRSDQSREMRDHLVGDAPCIPADPSGIQIHGGMEPLWPARPALAGL
jgi:hypothetical protein